jgi:hypothetical protein
MPRKNNGLGLGEFYLLVTRRITLCRITIHTPAHPKTRRRMGGYSKKGHQCSDDHESSFYGFTLHATTDDFYTVEIRV